MSGDEVCVVATGAYTPVGLSSAASAAAVRAGISAFSEHPSFNDRLQEPVICAMVPGDDQGDLARRCVVHLQAALNNALDALPAPARGPFLQGPLLVAVPEARPGLPSGFANLVADRLAREWAAGSRLLVTGIGHAGGGVALASVYERLRRGDVAWVTVAGVDSYLSAETVSWLDRNRQLHATYNAWGFIPGEAAGVLLLSTLTNARSVGLQPLAIVERVGIDREEVPITAEEGVCLGWGLTRCVQAALAGLAGSERIDRLYCDQNGQTYRADEMGFMLARLGNHFREPAAFVAPADCWGDVGAATVPLLMNLVVQAAARGYAAGPLSLVLAGSDSGPRAAVLLRTPIRSG